MQLNPGDLGSDVFELELSGQKVAVTAVPSAKTSEYPGMAAEYKKFPGYCWIDPPSRMGVHYAWLTSNEPLDLTLTCPEPVKKVVVLPVRNANAIKGGGKRVRMKIGLDEPRYYVFEIDGYPPLAILIDPVEEDIPNRESKSVLDLASLVSDQHSPEVRTAAIEDAIKKCSRDRKTLYVPAGVQHVNAIRVHDLDGVQIYFSPGSVWRTEVSPPGENIHRHGLWLKDSKNVRIWGRGCLDHQGYGNFFGGRNAYNHGLVSYYVSNDLCPFLSESPVFMMRCRKVDIEGFMVRNGRNMNFNIRRCDDVTLRHCKILTPASSTPEYGDGYHANSCVSLAIENCLAFANDDCFASGHYSHYDNRDSGTHTIKGLVGWNPRANGIRLGFATYFNQGEFLFENCHFGGITYSGIQIHPLLDAPEAHRFQRYGRVVLKDCSFQTGRLTDSLIDVMDVRMESLEMANVSFDRKLPFRIRGKSAEDGVKEATLSGVTVAGKPLSAGDVEAANASIRIAP